MLKYLVAIAVSFLFFCCNNAPQKSMPADFGVLKSLRNDSLYQLVCDKHDEVMPKDAHITAALNRLRKLENTTTQKDSLYGVLGDLTDAQKAMMDWMHDFNNTDLHPEFYEKLAEKQIWDYLLREEKRIEEVARLMLGSLEAAKKF